MIESVGVQGSLIWEEGKSFAVFAWEHAVVVDEVEEGRETVDGLDECGHVGGCFWN